MKHIFKKFRYLETTLTVIVILGVTTGLFLYTSGYRIKKGEDKPVDVNKTGMVSAKSIPEGASVYLDGILTTATNDTISGLKPGFHKLKIVKKGFVEWTKEIEVFEQLVTDITAVLVSQSPRLEPLTNTGADIPTVSHTLTKLAYTTNDDDKPGIWIIPLTVSALNLFRSNSILAIQDSVYNKFSQAKSIEWSPDEKQLLVENVSGLFSLVDIDTKTAVQALDPIAIRAGWALILEKKRVAFVEKLELPNNIRQLALSPKTMWSPDDKKFLYTVQNGDNLEYRVYDMEKPLPIGEKVENLVFTTKVSDVQPKISWYSDSFHFVLVENYSEVNKQGVLSIIRIDGTNKVEVYNNTLYSDTVYSIPGGEKIIFLTTFKSNNQENLYTISIR
jgi:hypothetical protein